jgi:RNA polymerase sigma factor (sigma-70 family)
VKLRRALVVCLLLAVAPAQAAVLYVKDSQKGGFLDSELVGEVVVDPGEGRYLLVEVGMEGAEARSVTVGGQPLGFIGASTSTAGHCRVEWWGLAAPPVGTHAFRIELSSPAIHSDANFVHYRGVASLGSFGAFASGNGLVAPLQVSLPSAVGEVVLDAVCGWSLGSQLHLAGENQRSYWHWSSGMMASAGSEKAGAPSVTMTWTDSGPEVMEWAAAAVALRPTGAPATFALDVGPAGCALSRSGGGPGGILVAVLAMLGLRALRREKKEAGTSEPPSRGTESEMRLHASRLAIAPPPPAAPELDGVTLARAKAGDRKAQAAIVHRYERPVFSLLWRMIGPHPAVVEDLTQETFLRVLRALDRFEDDGRARMVTWVLSIASRLAIDYLRSCKPRRDVAIVPGALPAAMPTPEHEVNRRALGAALVHAVDGLSPQFRAAFLLREVNGLSYDEIGLALDIDVGTVKSRLARARAALQAALVEMHDE